jgi:hypothetical protein
LGRTQNKFATVSLGPTSPIRVRSQSIRNSDANFLSRHEGNRLAIRCVSLRLLALDAIENISDKNMGFFRVVSGAKSNYLGSAKLQRLSGNRGRKRENR